VLSDNFGMLLWTFVGLAITGFHYLRRGQGRYRACGQHHDAPDVCAPGDTGRLSTSFRTAFGEAMVWLATPDFSKVTFATVLAAIGQAFFSIGVGMGGMMTYGSYLPAISPSLSPC
jgi:NSS family neurotransmitter:Na+ symporter